MRSSCIQFCESKRSAVRARRDITSSPLLECDIVMKGGITSGVVYPSAVAELSKSYRFRNIGGNSAGAIAATLTAAAEYRRQHADPSEDPSIAFSELGA